MRALVPLLLLALASCSMFQDGETNFATDFHDQWEFREVGTEKWLTATVPATVQENLIAHGIIKHPLREEAAADIEWVALREWEFQRTFSRAELPDHERFTWSFFGLDTEASIYLNDILVLECNNMFRTWELTVFRDQLLDENRLRIVFHSSIERGQKAAEALGFSLPAPNDGGAQQVSSFIRKAPYQFGWDWGPRVVTSGTWKNINLLAWDDLRYTNLRVVQDKIENDVAHGRAIFTVEAAHEMEVTLEFEVAGQRVAQKETLQKGSHEYTVDFSVNQPKRWWPNGWGKQHLYAAKGSLITAWEKRYWLTKNIGFRTVELEQNTDSIGTSFGLVVNGKPLFAKGANYIPQSMFPHAVEPSAYRTLLSDAKRSNFNMIRVWGGGIYEDELFYELCDSLGILVWQDFMFACSAYPPSESFRANVKAEARQQMARLSSHPSVALWCGNNEVNVAWKNWGWQSQFGFSGEEQLAIEQGYKALFQELLPEVVNEITPTTPYVHTSPLSNWGTPENFNHHNMHYWGVWHGTDEFNGFAENVPRFMSEYGFQSFPAAEAFEGQLDAENLNLSDSLLIKRQKSYKTTNELKRHLKMHYPLSFDYDTLAYLSQLNQRLAMQIAIDAHRKDRAHCRGTLYWQFNDVWAGPTWSTIDHGGNWKAAQYAVRDLYAAAAVIPEITENELRIFVANDNLRTEKLQLQWTSMTFSGDTIASASMPLQLEETSTNLAGAWTLTDVLNGHEKTSAFVVVKLSKGKLLLQERTVFFAEPKDLNLARMEPTVRVTQEDKKWIVTLESPTLIKDAYLDFNTPGTWWWNNYVDVLPNQPLTLFFIPKEETKKADNPKIISLNQVLNN